MTPTTAAPVRLRSEVLRPAAVSVLGRGVGGLLLVAYQAAVAHRVGLDGLGLVSLSLAVTSIAAVVGRRGGDLLVLRKISLAQDAAQADHSYRVAVRSSARSLLLVAMVQAATAPVLASIVFRTADLAVPLAVMAAAVPGYGMVALQGEALKARRRAGSGTAVQSVVGPAIATTVVLVWPNVDSVDAAFAFAFGTVIASLAAQRVWRSTVGRVPEVAVAAETTAAFRRESAPFLLGALWTLGLTWAPLLFTGAWSGANDAGTYAAADRVAQVLPVILVAVNAAVGPVVAPLFAAGDVDTLRRVLQRCTVAAAAGAVVVCGALAAFAPWILMIFKAESGAQELRILLLGHFVVLACGPVSVALAMAGAETVLHRIWASALVVQIALLVVLVPGYGASGAAAASALAWGGSRLVTALAARQSLLSPRSAVPTGVL